MPMQWTEPEVAVEHNGVTVWHTYKDGEYISEYWYTCNESDDDIDGESAFDIRELDVEGETHEDILRAAIEAGILPLERGED